MASNTSSTPSIIPAFLALLIIVVFGYLIFADLDTTHTEHTINPPIEIIEPNNNLPLTVISESTNKANSKQIIEQEAQQFVENLSPSDSENTPIVINEEDDQFVRQDSLISLANLEHRDTTIDALLLDEKITNDTLLTIQHHSEQRTVTTLAELSNSIEDHTAIITIITADGQSFSHALADLINKQLVELNEEITLVRSNSQTIQTSYGDLATLNISRSDPIQVTLAQDSQQIAIKDIIPEDEQIDDALFYVHRVTEDDGQGLWGIIQAGLIDKFRQGLPIAGINQNKELVSAVIPADADEKLTSGLSSFLGKILNNKVNNSYIYNFHSKTMGRNADIIQPGQQLVLITFQADELAQIYQFFSAKRNQGIETFAIEN